MTVQQFFICSMSCKKALEIGKTNRHLKLLLNQALLLNLSF